MLNNILDPVTGLPLKFGELFSDRNLKIVGSARWDAASGKVQTRGISLVLSPIDGGAPAVTVIPDGSYSLSVNASVWVQVRRTAGTSTAVFGSSLLADVSSQEKPKQNWIQLFIRTPNDEIVTFGNWLILGGTTFTKIGVTTASGVYDSIVGPADNPFATHTSIQGAIDDAADGSRILVLQGVYNIETPQKADISPTSAFAWSSKTVTIEGEGFGTVIVNAAGLASAFYIKSGSSVSNDSAGNGSKIIGIHLKNFDQSVVFDGGIGNGLRSCVVEVYNTSTASSTLSAPGRVGTGTFDLNTVKEFVTRNNSFSLRDYYVSNSTQTNTKLATGNEVFDSTSSRRLSIKTALRVGDTTTPTRTLDVIGDVRATSGNFYSPAASLLLMSDTGTSLPLKVGSLTVSNNYADSASGQGLLVRGNCSVDGSVVLGTDNNQSVLINSPVNANKTVRIGDNSAATKTLDVVGTIRTTSGQIYSSASALTLYTDASASLPLKAGSLTLSTNYADSATSQGLLVRGSAQIDGNVVLGTNTSQTVTINSPTYIRAFLRVGDNNIANRALDVFGSMRTTDGLIYSPAAYLGFLSDAGASLPTKVGSLVVSSSYADTVGAQGLLVRGAAQIDGTITTNNLTASQAVVTNASKVLASLPYTTTNTASALVQRDTAGGINVGGISAAGISASGQIRIANGLGGNYQNRTLYLEHSSQPGIGFHVPGISAAVFKWWKDGRFECRSQEDNGWATLWCGDFRSVGSTSVDGGLTAGGNITSGGALQGASVEVGIGRGGNGPAFVDLHGQAGQDYSARIIRWGGDSELQILQTGTTSIRIQGGKNQQTVLIPSSDGSHSQDWPAGWGGGLSTFDVCCSSIRAYISNRSDIRYKEKILPFSNGLDTILKFSPVSFYWKKDFPTSIRSKQYGFIAQEVEKFLPELIDGGENDGFRSMNYIGIIPMLVGAVQELNEKLEKITGFQE